MHPLKAPDPINVTLLGTVKSTKEVHSSNAPELIFSIPSFKTTLVSPLQDLNAQLPSDITDDGILISIILVHPSKT